MTRSARRAGGVARGGGGRGSGRTPGSAAFRPRPVLMGTEAVLHRVRRAAAVVFLDIDLHLLAPRFSATDETLALLAQPLVWWGRGEDRHGHAFWCRPGCRTIRCCLRWLVASRRRLLPPRRRCAECRAATVLSPGRRVGLVGHGYVDALRGAIGADGEGGAGDSTVTFSELDEDRYLVQAPDRGRALRPSGSRAPPAGRGLRVEVDPAAL